jgi:hypothetical protein
LAGKTAEASHGFGDFSYSAPKKLRVNDLFFAGIEGINLAKLLKNRTLRYSLSEPHRCAKYKAKQTIRPSANDVRNSADKPPPHRTTVRF